MVTFKVSKAGTLVPVMQITDTEVMVNDNAISQILLILGRNLTITKICF